MLKYPFHVTPYYCVVIENDKLQKEIQSVLEKIKFQYNPGWGKTQQLSDYSFESNIIDEFDMEVLKECFKPHIQNYCESLQFKLDKFNYTTSWFTLNQKNDYSHSHNHVADISGCYYFKTNGDDGNIFFRHPLNFLAINRNYDSFAFLVKEKPQIGKLLLFPGWMEHGVERNTTESDRISLSFNIDL